MQETSSYLGLEHELTKITSLQGLVISVMPDSLLYDSYFAQSGGVPEDDIASQLGELFQTCQGLSRMLKHKGDSQILVDGDSGPIIIQEVEKRFVAGMWFSAHTPLAVARSFAKHVVQLISERIDTEKTSSPEEFVSNAVRILRYLKQYAPDPHTSLMRIALKTGIPLPSLNQPQQLDELQTTKIERAVCDVLGVEELPF